MYYHDAAEETLAALNRLNSNMFDIQPIEANSEIVSSLVPGVLQRDAKSWLILYLPDREQDLLILPFSPFPDENNRPLLRDLEELLDYIDNWHYIIHHFHHSGRHWRGHVFRGRVLNRQHQLIHIDVPLCSLRR